MGKTSSLIQTAITELQNALPSDALKTGTKDCAWQRVFLLCEFAPKKTACSLLRHNDLTTTFLYQLQTDKMHWLEITNSNISARSSTLGLTIHHNKETVIAL